MVEYSVCATLPGDDTLREYLSWLESGHVQAVLRAGAVEAAILCPEAPPPFSVRVVYRFPDRPALDRYLADNAPRLRAEGATRFPPATGIRFERSTAIIIREFRADRSGMASGA